MILKDLITDVLDAADGTEIGKFISKKNPSIKSITRANKDLTMTFPVMVSNTVDPVSAQLVARALERKFVTLTQMLLSAISITSSKDAIDHLKNVHSNLDLSSFFDVDDYLAVSEEATAMHIFDADTVKAVYEAFRQERLRAKPINHLRESLMDDMMAQMRQNPNFNAAVAKNRFDSLSDDDQMRAVSMLDTDTATRNRNLSNQNRTLSNRNRDLTRQVRDLEGNEARLRRNFARNQSRINDRMRGLQQSNNNLQSRLDDIRNNTRAGLTKVTKDQMDYKKANELQPTLLQIQFISTNDNNDPITVDAYVGIKSKIYCVDSADIANHIVSKRSYNFSLYNLIKATSGEIEFWRDFVFAIKKAKIDAVSNTNRGSSSKLWKVLERRALASKINRFMSLRNDATAITTLVVSAYDVEMLRKMEDIDISNSRVARKLMDDYNLVGIVIVDDSTESAKFIFDTGDDEYEPYTFKTLKREDKMDYKQMIQLLAGGR
nr:MAG TPA: hypothetical protein [Caudoviricetes sp.]